MQIPNDSIIQSLLELVINTDIRVFPVNIKMPETEISASKEFTALIKVASSGARPDDQEIITGSVV